MYLILHMLGSKTTLSMSL